MVEVQPTVFIFEREPLWVELASEGVKQANWQALISDDPVDAASRFDERSSALITALGRRQHFLSGHFEASKLIIKSCDLNIPRAMLSGHPDAYQYVGEEPNILIPKTDADVTEKIAGWLTSLEMRQTA